MSLAGKVGSVPSSLSNRAILGEQQPVTHALARRRGSARQIYADLRYCGRGRPCRPGPPQSCRCTKNFGHASRPRAFASTRASPVSPTPALFVKWPRHSRLLPGCGRPGEAHVRWWSRRPNLRSPSHRASAQPPRSPVFGGNVQKLLPSLYPITGPRARQHFDRVDISCCRV